MDETEPKFDELDKVKLKTHTVGMYGGTIPAGSEGFVWIFLPQILIHIVKKKGPYVQI